MEKDNVCNWEAIAIQNLADAIVIHDLMEYLKKYGNIGPAGSKPYEAIVYYMGKKSEEIINNIKDVDKGNNPKLTL